MKALTDVQGIGDATVRILADHGIRSVKALAKAETSRLTDIPGFGEARAEAIIRSARGLMASPGKDAPEKKKSRKDKTGKDKKNKKGKEKQKTKDKKDKKKKKTKGKKSKGKDKKK